MRKRTKTPHMQDVLTPLNMVSEVSFRAFFIVMFCRSQRMCERIRRTRSRRRTTFFITAFCAAVADGLTVTNVDHGCHKSCTNSNLTVQIEVAFPNIRPVSNLKPHMKNAQIWFENVRFNALWAVHTVIQVTDLCPMRIWGGIWATISCSVNVAREAGRSRQT